MRFVSMAFLVCALLLPLAATPSAASAEGCQFVLGFKALRDLIPTVVGECKDDEHHNPANGDGLQQTTGPDGKGGLMVWRKADNWTAFTDGYRTWINGPQGLQQRLNTERFPWEGDYAYVFVLKPEDLPKNFAADENLSGARTNQEIATLAKDPGLASVYLERRGRRSGYEALYYKTDPNIVVGTVMVSSVGTTFDTAESARAAMADVMFTYSALDGTAVSLPKVGDESVAAKFTRTSGPEGLKIEWTIYLLTFRKGSAVGTVSTMATSLTANTDDLVRYARTMEERIRN